MQNRAPRRYSLNSFCCQNLLIWWMLLSNALNTYIVSVHDLSVTEITAVDSVRKESFVFKTSLNFTSSATKHFCTLNS